MDIATIAGLVLAVVIVIAALILDGGSPLEMLAAPQASISTAIPVAQADTHQRLGLVISGTCGISRLSTDTMSNANPGAIMTMIVDRSTW